jgi:hypothetical protein
MDEKSNRQEVEMNVTQCYLTSPYFIPYPLLSGGSKVVNNSCSEPPLLHLLYHLRNVRPKLTINFLESFLLLEL